MHQYENPKHYFKMNKDELITAVNNSIGNISFINQNHKNTLRNKDGKKNKSIYISIDKLERQ